MTPQDLINALIFQVQFQLQFGGGDGSGLSASFNPGVVSQSLYATDSDVDPLGQSYYGSTDPARDPSIVFQSGPSKLSQFLRQQRLPYVSGVGLNL
jgi:hypothetical protein